MMKIFMESTYEDKQCSRFEWILSGGIQLWQGSLHRNSGRIGKFGFAVKIIPENRNPEYPDLHCHR
jgi:hypothetical protein